MRPNFNKEIEQYNRVFKDKRFNGPFLVRHDLGEDPLNINWVKGDCAKITNSKAFRRLAYKTQVFTQPINPHVRTRSSHTHEVAAISEVLADFLGLNSDLCRAIGSGHDIGHVPFGHAGEEVISKIAEENGDKRKFNHAVYGVVIAQKIERGDGKGLNLTYQTLEGMLHHSRKGHQLAVNPNFPLEYAVVMYSDKLAYVFADIHDAERMERLKRSDFPKDINFDFNQNHRILTNKCLNALIEESAQAGKISFKHSDTAQNFLALRAWMYENVYHKIDWGLQERMLRRTYLFLSENKNFNGVNPLIMMTLMTDQQVTNLCRSIKSNRPVNDNILEEQGILELVPYVQRVGDLDYSNPDLNIKDFIYSDIE